LAKTGNRSVHSMESYQRKHLSVLLCINADGSCIPNFYIVKGTYFLDDYVNHCEQNVVRTMQPNVWMAK
jgi:hypothetical protein